MKRIIQLILISALAFSSCQQQQAIPINNAEDFKAVELVIQGVFDDIWSAKKEEQLSKYHTEDFILLEHGEVWTNDTIANWCKRAKIRDKGVTRINSFDFFKAKREGNRIWMAYHNYATIKKDTLERKLQWLESVVGVNNDSVWKLEMMHSTRVNRK